MRTGNETAESLLAKVAPWVAPARATAGVRIGSVTIVLLDHEADPKPFGQFPNLWAFDALGVRVWVAELPTTTTGDCYYRIRSTEPLVALSVASYACSIDPATGRILHAEFYI